MAQCLMLRKHSVDVNRYHRCYGNHGRFLFLERPFVRPWAGRSWAGLGMSYGRKVRLYMKHNGKPSIWDRPSYAPPVPTHHLHLDFYTLSLLPPMPNTCRDRPFFQTIPFQSVKTLHFKEWWQDGKEVKTGAESICFAKWAIVFSSFFLNVDHFSGGGEWICRE